MEKHDETWWALGYALFDLAHGDRRRFDQLPPEARETEVGRLCQKYVETDEYQYIDQAGKLLTGSDNWYTYLGRSF